MDPAARAELEQALTWLATGSPEQREAGASTLVELAHEPGLDSELRPRLISLLSDTHPPLRAAACAGLLACGPAPDLVELLARALQDAEAPVRREAARSLASLEDPAARPPLKAALADADAQARFEAAVGLAALRDGGGVEILLQAVEDPVRRFAALGALAQLGEPRAREVAERVLGRFFMSDFERTQAAGVLARLGVEAGREHLLGRLKRRRADDRGLAMELCGEHRVLAAIPILREALHDRRDPWRGTAARSLGMLGEDPSGDTLARLAEDSTEEFEVRCDAMEGLMFLGTPGAVAALNRLEREGATDVREAAAEALAWLKEHREHPKA